MFYIDFKTAYNLLINSIVNKEFYGYDPYDGLNTKIAFAHKTKLTRLFFIYFNKFSPFNFRPFLKIAESQQLMTMCIVANSIELYQGSFSASARRDIYDQIWSKMERSTLKNKYAYHSWDAHEFPIQMLNRYTKGDVASTVGNQQFGEFLISYYNLTKKLSILNYIVDLRDFFINKFYCENSGYAFFKYKSEHSHNRFTLNASLKAVRFLVESCSVLNNDEYKSFSDKAVDTIIKLQKPDGRWNYSYNVIDKNEDRQVDFHQGYILDDLLFYSEKYGFTNDCLNAYEKGLDFYFKKQFLPNGQGIYRYPRKWPVNIHNQAQGIITFTRAAKAGFGDHYFDFARTIAEWTLKQMQSPDGHFYFLKYPWFTNKIPYVRWSDAAMAYALAVFLEYAEER